jgi:hypothetical protein
MRHDLAERTTCDETTVVGGQTNLFDAASIARNAEDVAVSFDEFCGIRGETAGFHRRGAELFA